MYSAGSNGKIWREDGGWHLKADRRSMSRHHHRTHAGPSLSSSESERELKMRLLVGGPEAFKHITHPQHLRSVPFRHYLPNICSSLFDGGKKNSTGFLLVQSTFFKSNKKLQSLGVWLIDLLAVFVASGWDLHAPDSLSPGWSRMLSLGFDFICTE